MPAIDKRGFVYIRKSDEYAGDHPNFTTMKMNGFTVPVVRPPDYDPFAIATAKEARKQGLYPALWEVPKRFQDGSREDPIVFANRFSEIAGDFDEAEAYTYALVCDNEDLPVAWHEAFAPAFAAMRTRKKILSIDPLKGDMWNVHNIYAPYIANGFSIDIQCYNGQMDYFGVARCFGVVAGTPGVNPWNIRVTLPPGRTAEILASGLDKMGPIGIGLFAPNAAQIEHDLPIYGQFISGAVLPKVLAYK